MQIAFGKPQLSSGTEIRRNGGKAFFTTLNGIVGHHLSIVTEHALTAQQSAATPGEIHQAQHIPVAKGADPLFKCGRRLLAHAAHQRTDGTTRDDIYLYSHLL